MSRTVKFSSAVVGFGVLLSQLGHLLVYQLQFGSAALAVQSTGTHAYFPALVKTGLALAAAALLASLLVIGAARIASGGRARAIGNGPSYVSLLGTLFTVQLMAFALQETAESLAAGTALPSAPHLVLLGTVGQLPVAALAAAALTWLAVRFESAITEIRVALASVRSPISRVAAAVAAWDRQDLDLVLNPVLGSSPAKRGPPSSLRFSSN